MINTDGLSSATLDLLQAALSAALSAAVPMWIEQLRELPFEQILERAKVCGQAVAEKGDVLQFGNKKKDGKAAEAFNRLAEGLACLSFAPGGVKFLEMKFEARQGATSP